MSYGDINAFGDYTLAALTDPTYGGEQVIRALDTGLNLDSTFNYMNQDAGNSMKYSSKYSKFGATSNPRDFAIVLGSTLFDGSIDSLYNDSILNSINVGLSAQMEANFTNSMNVGNPFQSALDGHQFKFSINNSDSIKPDWSKIDSNSNNSNWNFSINHNSGVSVSGENVDYSKNSEKENFNKAVALIKAYGKKTGKSYDDKLNKVAKEMKGSYKTGLAKLKSIIATFDAKKLTEVVREISHKIYDDKEAKGKTISDTWANQISNAKSASSFKVDTSQVNKDNILSVLGTYISNPKFKTGGMWNSLIKNNYDAISNALIENAKDFLKSGKCTNETTKHKIRGLMTSLQKDGDIRQKVSTVYKLFDILRQSNASYNDNKTFSIVGGGAIPHSKVETTPDDYQTKKYQAEKKAYDSSSKLNAKG